MKRVPTRTHAATLCLITLVAHSGWADDALPSPSGDAAIVQTAFPQYQPVADAPALQVDQQLSLETQPVPVATNTAPDADRIVLADASRIDASQLTEIRAGADVGSSLSVSFAIERTVSIDGQILAATTLKWSNLGNNIAASVTNSLAGAGLIAGQPGNAPVQIVVPVPTAAGTLTLTPSGAMSGATNGATNVTLISVPNNVLPVQVIQNSVDNRIIQASTVLSVSTSSFSQALSNRVMESLNAGLVRGSR
ncbi:hypothetical protein R0381_000879 [Jeongeupia wiesaeckerbachi]|uniref:hypothetical protein n=1 Tax=Jeongeupia wiesaeckerbachi TaxID=3051218 RepID=UPI003D809CF6